MHILVTGGTGYIGSHTVLELLKKGLNVTVIDNLTNSKREALRRVESLSDKKAVFHKIDLLDQESLLHLFRESDFDSVIHFAGLKAVGESVEKPLLYYRNNVAGTINLCRAMSDSGVRKMVFSSSATVYGDPESVPIRENFPLSATNPYGRSKLMIEEILQDLCKSDPDWSVALLRYFNPVGADGSGKIGEDPQGIPNNLMPFISQVAVGKRKKLAVFGRDWPTRDGTGVRDYIHVTDLARGHLAAVRYLEEHSGIETFNLGTGEGYSVLEMIRAFELASGKEIPWEFVERRPGDIAECFADPGKAEHQLGWRAEKSLEEMCRDAWNWQKSHPEGYPEE
ncbi:MAG: UDP-glucose 4-epimerase GalE [Balneolaceae bacterium]